MAPLNSFNDREAMMDLAKSDIMDIDVSPNYDWVKKRAPAAVIKGPVAVKEPPHLPDRLLYPEQWRFYDGNLDAVRPNLDIGGQFAAEDQPTFQLREKEREVLREYLQMQHRVPDPAYYEPIFKLLDSGVPVPSFGRYLERSRLMTKSELLQREVDGDNLILNPEPVRKNLGNVADFQKMTGRPEALEHEPLKDVLVLDVNRKLRERRVVNLVNMVLASNQG